jgi:hypothetical protein
MTPDNLSKWEQLLESVEKKHVPVQFIKKIIIKMLGKKQQTINIQNLLKQGLEPEEVEEVVSRKLYELDPMIVSVEFILSVETIAEVVQPETDKILGRL